MKSLIISYCILFTLINPVTTRAQHRKVLIEQFTNSGCPPCAGNTPVVADYVNSHSDSVLMIAYHTSFPYQDSMYHENPIQSNSRVAFYNVVGVPRSIVDGNYFSGNLLSTISTTLLARAAEPPRYLINFTSGTLNNTLVEFTISFESVSMLNQNESLVAHIVFVEKNVLKSSYVCCAGANTEIEYPWVMRRMVPDENGTPIINTSLGGTDLLTISANANNFKDLNELRVISFVQNSVTKEIYQAEILQPQILTSGENDMTLVEEIFHFTNPIMNNVLELFFEVDDRHFQIEISDINGKNIYSGFSNMQKNKSIDVSNLKNGVYFIAVTDQSVNEVKRLVILSN